MKHDDSVPGDTGNSEIERLRGQLEDAEQRSQRAEAALEEKDRLARQYRDTLESLQTGLEAECERLRAEKDAAHDKGKAEGIRAGWNAGYVQGHNDANKDRGQAQIYTLPDGDILQAAESMKREALATPPPESDPCDTCGGARKIAVDTPCPDCQGRGRKDTPHTPEQAHGDALAAVNEIMGDLSDRRGLLDQVDNEAWLEIRDALATILGRHLTASGVPEDRVPHKCPSCGSPHPDRHPAVQFEGEVIPCRDPWHQHHPGDLGQKTAESVLRSLASWLGVGGYNADRVDPATFEAKIREGVESAIRVEKQRASGVPEDRESAIWLVAEIMDKFMPKPPGPPDSPFEFQPKFARNALYRQAERAIDNAGEAALAAAPANEYKLVPVEPTEEMLAALITSTGTEQARREPVTIMRNNYRRMIAAAPQRGGE